MFAFHTYRTFITSHTTNTSVTSAIIILSIIVTALTNLSTVQTKAFADSNDGTSSGDNNHNDNGHTDHVRNATIAAAPQIVAQQMASTTTTTTLQQNNSADNIYNDDGNSASQKTTILYDDFRFHVDAAAATAGAASQHNGSSTRINSTTTSTAVDSDDDIPNILMIYTYPNEEPELFIESRHKHGNIQSSDKSSFNRVRKRGVSKALQRAAEEGLQAMMELYNIHEPSMLRKGVYVFVHALWANLAKNVKYLMFNLYILQIYVSYRSTPGQQSSGSSVGTFQCTNR